MTVYVVVEYSSGLLSVDVHQSRSEATLRFKESVEANSEGVNIEKVLEDEFFENDDYKIEIFEEQVKP